MAQTYVVDENGNTWTKGSNVAPAKVKAALEAAEKTQKVGVIASIVKLVSKKESK